MRNVEEREPATFEHDVAPMSEVVEVGAPWAGVMRLGVLKHPRGRRQKPVEHEAVKADRNQQQRTLTARKELGCFPAHGSGRGAMWMDLGAGNAVTWHSEALTHGSPSRPEHAVPLTNVVNGMEYLFSYSIFGDSQICFHFF